MAFTGTATLAFVWAPLLASAAVAGYAAYAAAWPTSQRWGSSIHALPGKAADIALTFDDGPSNETARFIDALHRLNVPATFFVCGRNVKRRPEVARLILEAGHAIGNHTYSHPCLPLCSRSRVSAEVARAQDAIAAATGTSPTLFRPPFGLRSPALRTVLPAHGLRGIHWSVIGKDWKRNADQISDRLLRCMTAGSIVCLHDGDRTSADADRSQTLAAVLRVVPILRDRGLRFVKLDSARIDRGPNSP